LFYMILLQPKYTLFPYTTLFRSSTGGSSIKALEALKENGANVVTVLAIFTYGIEGVREKFTDLGYNLEILLNLDELLECALDRATIDQSGVDIVKNFRDSL